MLAWPVASSCTGIFLQAATGAVVSTTVTVAVQLSLLPLLSVTVKVTVFGPTLAQVKVSGLTLREAIPQASLEPLSTSDAAMVAWPVASRLIVIFWHLATGLTLSSTVTVLEQLELFPLASTRVRVTVLGPTLAQVKALGLTLREAMPQAASLEPLSTSAAVLRAWPVASSCTVIFLQAATGAVLSTTVTVAVQLSLLPLLSVTVKVTVFGPTLAQVKVSGLTLREAIPQCQ